jgi:hypothetical protein
MEEQTSHNLRDELDRATAARLAKLRTMPVDTSRLESLVRAQIPRSRGRWGSLHNRWARPLEAAAGIIILVAAITFLLSAPSRPVTASAAELAQFHEDLLSGRGIIQVDSIAQANQAIAAQWAQSPAIPDVPSDHVMACCMKSIRDRKVACLLFKGEKELVTLTVARASEMSMPNWPTTVRNRIGYDVTSLGTLNMVRTQRNGSWICLIGRLPVERLMDLSSKLAF